MKRRSQDEKILLGEAAEHLVLSRILRKGHLAGRTPRGWKTDDLLLDSGVRVQVKATDRGPKTGWMVGDVKPEPQRVYALVDYRDETAPVVYVVPSKVVAKAVGASDRQYHRERPHAAHTTMRKVQDPWAYEVPGYKAGWLNEYAEAWEHVVQ